MTFHVVCSERYRHRSRDLEAQLKELKVEIEDMKVTESDLDRQHEVNLLNGQRNKRVTLQKVSGQ